MGIVIGIAVVIVLVGLILRIQGRRGLKAPSPDRSTRKAHPEPHRTPAAGSPLRSDIETAVQRDYGSGPATAALPKLQREAKGDHVPPSPSGGGSQAWSPRTRQLEVAGEWYRRANLRTLFTRHATVSEHGAEIRLGAILVPDPTNPYDRCAVAVFVDHLHVGYMERADARTYHATIANVPGGELNVPSRQWLRGTTDDTWARVTLSIPRPDELECPNPVLGEFVSLPPGSTVQVTREEEFMNHLVQALDHYGTDKVIAASLRSVTERRPRSTIDLVAVDVDGEQVGVLSTAQTANFLPLVRRAEAAGRRLTCRASLRGNALKADVALHARKAHEYDEEQLRRLFDTI